MLTPSVSPAKITEIWTEEPGDLWNLWLMLKAYAKAFVELQRILEFKTFELSGELKDDFQKVPTDARSRVDKECFIPLERICRELNLGAALQKISYMRGKAVWEVEWACEGLVELQEFVEKELASRQFLYVPKSRYWENEVLFGEEVFVKIPEATHDIYEAGSCLAAGRADATVYHCMGIMQAVTYKAGEKIGCTINLDADDWGSAEMKIRNALNNERKIAEQGKDHDVWATWKRKEASYNELISDLRAVKYAWRHTSMHFRQTFTIEQAEKILDKVTDFAVHVAKRIL